MAIVMQIDRPKMCGKFKILTSSTALKCHFCSSFLFYAQVDRQCRFSEWKRKVKCKQKKATLFLENHHRFVSFFFAWIFHLGKCLHCFQSTIRNSSNEKATWPKIFRNCRQNQTKKKRNINSKIIRFLTKKNDFNERATEIFRDKMMHLMCWPLSNSETA